MTETYENRCVQLGEYIAKTGATVRVCAKTYGLSKSTVHKDVAERLKLFDPGLYKKVKIILDINKAERHIRGGLATRKKYKSLDTRCQMPDLFEKQKRGSV